MQAQLMCLIHFAYESKPRILPLMEHTQAQACIYLGFAWILAILFLGYVFRCTETTACEFQYSTHPACLEPNAQVHTHTRARVAQTAFFLGLSS